MEQCSSIEGEGEGEDVEGVDADTGRWLWYRHQCGKYCFWSNLSMLLPSYIAYCNGMHGFSGVLVTTMTLSMYFHLDENNTTGLVVDVAGVVALSASLMFLLMRAKYVWTPMGFVSVFYALWAISAYIEAGEDTLADRYQHYHTMWHVLGSYGITALLYSYVNTNVKPANTSRLSRPVITKQRLGAVKEHVRPYLEWLASRHLDDRGVSLLSRFLSHFRGRHPQASPHPCEGAGCGAEGEAVAGAGCSKGGPGTCLVRRRRLVPHRLRHRIIPLVLCQSAGAAGPGLQV